MRQEITKVKDTVEEILGRNEDARNSDKILVYLVRSKISGKTLFGFHDIMMLPSAESIRRVRQKLQEEGKYKGINQEHRAEFEREMKSKIFLPL